MALIKQDIETLLNLKLVEADAIRERKFHVCVDAVNSDDCSWWALCFFSAAWLKSNAGLVGCHACY